jgi:PIN domain
MNILLDTNIYYNKFDFESPEFRLLFEYLDISGGNLMIPTIIEWEVNRLISERFESIGSDLKNLQDFARGQVIEGDSAHGLLDLDVNYQSFLDIRDGNIVRLSQKHRIEFIPVSQDQLLRSIKRNLSGRKPGKDTNLRDSLIWETVLERARWGLKVILVSKNTSDFGKDGKLHSALLQEIEEERLSGKIYYAQSIYAIKKIDASEVVEHMKLAESRLDKYERIKILWREVQDLRGQLDSLGMRTHGRNRSRFMQVMNNNMRQQELDYEKSILSESIISFEDTRTQEDDSIAAQTATLETEVNEKMDRISEIENIK